MNKIEMTEFDNKIIELLKEEKTQIGVCIRSVAKSGMSRVLSFHAIYNNQIINVNYQIGLILDIKSNFDGLRVRGCGMDMIFDTLYKFYKAVGIKEYSAKACTYTRI